MDILTIAACVEVHVDTFHCWSRLLRNASGANIHILGDMQWAPLEEQCRTYTLPKIAAAAAQVNLP